MTDYHKIFIGIEFTKKDTWKWNILYLITSTEGLSTIKRLSKTSIKTSTGYNPTFIIKTHCVQFLFDLVKEKYLVACFYCSTN